MDMPTVPPSVLFVMYQHKDQEIEGTKAVYRMRPNVAVLVAISLIGIAACKPISGVYVEGVHQ
jgi:hypothetical protein